MIHHLRLRLTLFNTAVTGAILIAMTALCLFLSQRDARAQAFQSFTGDLDAMSAYLSNQDRLSLTWLRQMERSGNLRLGLWDGEVPLYSMGLSDQQARAVLEQARAQAGQRRAFAFTGPDGGHYYAGVLPVGRDDALVLAALYPLDGLEVRIARQRLAVGLGAGVALGLLAAFSWVFTGRLLRPVEQSQRRQAQFIAAASHELRTPLAAILSAVQCDQEAPFAPMITREGQRMARLVEDLLCLTAADGGSWAIRPESVELDMLVLEVYEATAPRAREKGLKLTVSLPEEGGPALELDPDRLRQALSILLDNALSYTPAPGTVGLALRWSRSHARITVSDTGPGVPKEQRGAIFQRFYRGQQGRSDRTHFGLGLSIAAEIVRLHQGKLHVEDAPEGGAAFVLELPVKLAADGARGK